MSIVRAFARQLGATFGLRPGDGGRGTVAELVFDDSTGRRQERRGAGAAGAAA